MDEKKDFNVDEALEKLEEINNKLSDKNAWFFAKDQV